MEGYEKNKEYLRFSLRCAGNKSAIKAFYALTMLYFEKSTK